MKLTDNNGIIVCITKYGTEVQYSYMYGTFRARIPPDSQPVITVYVMYSLLDMKKNVIHNYI